MTAPDGGLGLLLSHLWVLCPFLPSHPILTSLVPFPCFLLGLGAVPRGAILWPASSRFAEKERVRWWQSRVSADTVRHPSPLWVPWSWTYMP